MNDILTDIISATARNNCDPRYRLSMFYYASSVYLCRSLVFCSCCCFDHIDRLLQNETHRLSTVLGCALRSEKAKILLLYNVTKKKINQATNPGLHYYYCYYSVWSCTTIVISLLLGKEGSVRACAHARVCVREWALRWR